MYAAVSSRNNAVFDASHAALRRRPVWQWLPLQLCWDLPGTFAALGLLRHSR